MCACRLMRCNFSVMRRLGDRVLRPFLQVAILADNFQQSRVPSFSPTAHMLRTNQQHDV